MFISPSRKSNSVELGFTIRMARTLENLMVFGEPDIVLFNVVGSINPIHSHCIPRNRLLSIGGSFSHWNPWKIIMFPIKMAMNGHKSPIVPHSSSPIKIITFKSHGFSEKLWWSTACRNGNRRVRATRQDARAARPARAARAANVVPPKRGPSRFVAKAVGGSSAGAAPETAGEGWAIVEGSKSKRSCSNQHPTQLWLRISKGYLVVHPTNRKWVVHPSDFSGLTLLIPCKSLGL